MSAKAAHGTRYVLAGLNGSNPHQKSLLTYCKRNQLKWMGNLYRATDSTKKGIEMHGGGLRTLSLVLQVLLPTMK